MSWRKEKYLLFNSSSTSIYSLENLGTTFFPDVLNDMLLLLLPPLAGLYRGVNWASWSEGGGGDTSWGTCNASEPRVGEVKTQTLLGWWEKVSNSSHCSTVFPEYHSSILRRCVAGLMRSRAEPGCPPEASVGLCALQLEQAAVCHLGKSQVPAEASNPG